MTDLLTPALDAGTIGWYLPPSFDPALLKDAAGSAPFLTVKGRGGTDLAVDARTLPKRPPVLLDPSQYEAAKVKNGRVKRHGWAERQIALDVAAFVSPGAYLARATTAGEAGRLLRVERDWVRSCPKDGRRAFIAVAVDAHFLRDQVDDLIKILSDLDSDIWMTLSGRNDPLALQGSVEALVRLLSACPRIAVMRCDIGGLGSLAFGALLASIGLTGTVRHSPDGGGGTRNEIPVVFVRTLQSFKKTDLLQAWVQRDPDIEYCLGCLESCCGGESILRLADPAYATEATIHNMLALREVIDSVLELEAVADRQTKFISLAKHAWYQHEALSDSIDTIKVDAQLRQWAQLRS